MVTEKALVDIAYHKCLLSYLLYRRLFEDSRLTWINDKDPTMLFTMMSIDAVAINKFNSREVFP